MITEYDLIQVEAPQKTHSYQPVPHLTLINTVKEKLDKHNLKIVNTRYDANTKGAQMFGVYDLNIGGTDTNLNIGFRNSYDKSLPVGMVAGGTVIVCKNLMFKGDIKVLRKHTKGVFSDLDHLIENVISSAVFQFEQLTEDKERMKLKPLNKTQMAELAGRMYVEEKLISPTQMSILADEIRHSEHFTDNSLWDFYNHATEALKKSHPAHLIPNHIKAHEFVMQFA